MFLRIVLSFDKERQERTALTDAYRIATERFGSPDAQLDVTSLKENPFWIKMQSSIVARFKLKRPTDVFRRLYTNKPTFPFLEKPSAAFSTAKTTFRMKHKRTQMPSTIHRWSRDRFECWIEFFCFEFGNNRRRKRP